MTEVGGHENRLWRCLASEPAAAVARACLVTLQPHEVLQEPSLPPLYVYFPVTAVVALVSAAASGESTEVAVVGSEGLVNLSGVFGSLDSPIAAVVLVGGTAMRVPTHDVRAARLRSADVRDALDSYTQLHLVQVAQTAMCNRLHTVDERLARWLLELHDRVAGGDVPVSHEVIAAMLGVHRPTVTSALQRFSREGAISQRRGALAVSGRAILERLTCECHDTVRRAVAHLLERDGRPCLAAPSAGGPPSPPAQRRPSSGDALREIAGRLLLVSLREQEARERAEVASRARDQLLATLAEQLRAPLNAILGWCATLEAQHVGAAAHGLQAIERHARAQLALVEQLHNGSVSTATALLQPAPVGPARGRAGRRRDDPAERPRPGGCLHSGATEQRHHRQW